MKYMTGNEIRKAYLQFFKSKEHLILPQYLPHLIILDKMQFDKHKCPSFDGIHNSISLNKAFHANILIVVIQHNNLIVSLYLAETTIQKAYRLRTR